MQSHPIKKSIFQHTKTSISRCIKTNVQPQISSVKIHCELAVQQPFFETLQSCVSSTVTLSHRFKAFSPPFCAKSRVRHVPSENSAKIFFDRALNRPRSPEVRKPLACFLVLFARRKKNKIVLFAENIEVLQTSNQPTRTTTSHEQN